MRCGAVFLAAMLLSGCGKPESFVPDDKMLADVAVYEKAIAETEIIGELLHSVSVGKQAHEVVVSVRMAWLDKPKQARLLLAQSLQGAWSKIHSPDAPAEALIVVIDEVGNRLGGSETNGTDVRVNE